MAWATEEAKARFLPKLASGEEIWCQLFSSRPAAPTWPACAPAR
jgi:alkylation response protein AidB-like acyl-CoA dehydrogenase